MTAAPPPDPRELEEAAERASRVARETQRYQRLTTPAPSIGVLLGSALVVILLMLGAWWLLRRMGQGDLFSPVLFIVLGITFIIEVKLDATQRRVDALIELLEERGVLKR